MCLIFQVAGLMTQVDGESNSWGFCLVPFFFNFSTKEGWGQLHNSWEKFLALSP